MFSKVKASLMLLLAISLEVNGHPTVRSEGIVNTKFALHDLINHVNNISLPTPPRSSRRATTNFLTGSDSANVNAGSIVLVPATTPSQQATDANWWTLFAQLAADKTASTSGYTRVTNPGAWYNRYFAVLEQIGATPAAIESFTLTGHDIQATVAENILVNLKPRLDAPAQDTLDRAMSSLSTPANAQGLSIFNGGASSTNGANCQVFDATVDGALNINIRFTSLDFFVSDQIVQDCLFFRFENFNFNLNFRETNLVLGKATADGLRDTMRTRILPFLAGEIGDIAL